MNDAPHRHSFFYRYGTAVVSVAAAAGVSRLLSGLGDSGISPQFFAAIVFSAWYGGMGAGLLATVLSGLAATYLLIASSAASPADYRDDVFRVAVFTVVALLTSSLHAASRRAQAAAESANAAKSQFLAMVSHELLTPLSPMLMAAEMLLDDPSLSERVALDLETIRRNIHLEIRLINDLLDVSRIATGKLQIHREVTDLHQIIRAAIALCENEIADREQTLRISLDAQHHALNGDPLRLQQVFWNLIRNASKFTPHAGTISIATRDTAGGIEIEITDTGIGIDASRLSSIFNAFEQGDSDVRVRFGGLGLGLAIAESLTAAHGGKIAAASQGKGRGATFTVLLPVTERLRVSKPDVAAMLPSPVT